MEVVCREVLKNLSMLSPFLMLDCALTLRSPRMMKWQFE